MVTRALILVTLFVAMASDSLHAQGSPAARQYVAPAAIQKVRVPGSNYEFVPGSVWFSSGGSTSTDALLAELGSWISDNFDIPRSDVLPTIELVRPATITMLRYQGLAGSQMESGTPGQAGQREVVSIYRHANNTIYLPDTWTGSTPAEMSVLVHEIVHHLQSVGNVKFECPQEMEQLAYKAQARWLGLFGHDLLTDFEIDPFTLLVSTKCFY